MRRPLLHSLNIPLISFILLVLSHLKPAAAQTAGNVPTNATVLPVGSCLPNVPCSNGACCNGNSGFCGFGPDFCGAGVCTSNCNALAECGPFAAAENTTCPLNVCCSQFGFCGTTTDFCDEGCQSNCGGPPIPSCDVEQNSAMTRRIGYYEGWAVNRKCMAYPPEQIAADSLTHINFAFALISSSLQVIEMTPGDSDLWRRTTALKAGRPALKVFLSIGGWTFNDPPTQSIFSNMVSSSANINTFLSSLLNVMETYAFDGVDIDWEYPAAFDRGGAPGDKENYVNFMKAAKGAFSARGYGLTFTAPSSFWYLQHFDLPGMLKYADWVNVMTYDLHGVWDGIDPYIGYVIGAHTNLTEIDAAFQLYWRVGVDPKQMVMGMGFYGRTFTLASADCDYAGCAWTSGGNAGPCSGNAGTLMWQEIEAVLTDTQAAPKIDEVAAVAYVTWDNNQWVSYDTDQTFALKMSYANDHCIGGTMIWSVDQDDINYNALEALYPSLSASTGIGHELPESDSSNDACFVSDCGAQSCYPANLVDSVYWTPQTGSCDIEKGIPAVVCCPDIKPQSCTKRGYTDAKTTCVPQCMEGEILIAKDIIGDTVNDLCISGMTALCCTEPLPDVADCVFSPCSSTPDISCPSNFSNFQTSLSTADGVCPDGTAQGFCCENPLPFANCEWIGTPPICDDAVCAVGQLTIFTDPLGDGTQPCTGGAQRTYCCDPPVTLPAPFSDIFPSGVPDNGNDLFHVDFDPDVGGRTSSATSESGTQSTFTESENEDSGAFGEVFIDSPKPGSVSSLDLHTNWVLTSCNSKSDQPQQVPAYCSKAASEACQHVFIDGAVNTIVTLPKSCGLGPYARVISLEPHSNQSILSAVHTRAKPASESVYLLSFDYNFAAIPESNGPIYMRADVTDMPGYWDSVVDSPPERREWLEKRGLWNPPKKEKRWWGSFTTWLSKINTIESDNSQTRAFFWSDTWNIYHTEQHCDGPPAFDGSLDISLTGQANLNARYGFYLQGTIVPPAVTAAYVHFNSDASASATFTIKGTAAVTYNSDTVTFASFGFPGLYYPGLLTVGPSLVLEGYIAGQISVTGQMTTGLSYQFPPIHYSLGKGTDDIGPAAQPSPPSQGFDYGFGYNVELSGDLSVHVVPTVQLGISILGGQLIDAQAYIRADLYAGIEITGSVNSASAAKVCINPHYGLIVEGGVTGSVLFWETSTTPFSFYNQDFVFGGGCFSSAQEPQGSASGRRSLPEIAASGGIIPQHGTPTNPGAVIVVTKENEKRTIRPEVSTDLAKRVDGVPFISGLFNCPSVDQEVGQDNSDDDIYSDALSISTDDDEVYKREVPFRFGVSSSNDSFSHLPPEVLVTVSGCSITFDPNAYNNIGTGYYNLNSPTQLDPSFSVYTTAVGYVNTNTYGREHVYEMQLLSDFISTLAQTSNLWQNAAGSVNYCTWAKAMFNTGSSYATINQGSGKSVINRLQACQPSNSGSATSSSMPWLESTANGIKARAFSGSSLRTSSTFKRYSYSKKVFNIRAAAGVVSYMLDGPVSDQFVQVSNCVKGVWTDWYTAYNADTTVDAPNKGQVNMGTVYKTYITGKVQNTFLNLRSGIQQMIGFYSTSAGGDANSEQVDLNYGTLVQGNTLVSANDLTSSILNPVSSQSLVKITVRL